MARTDAFRELRKGREQAEHAPTHYRADHCEVRGCAAGPGGRRGKPDIAIQDSAGNVMGYACQACYDRIVCSAGRDRFAKVRGDADHLTPEAVAAYEPEVIVRDPTPQLSFEQQRNAQHVADILGNLNEDFDRYAESMAESTDDRD